MDLVYKHEKPLFRISATISILLWILLIVGTLGTALIFMLLAYVFFLFGRDIDCPQALGSAIK